MAAFTGGTMPEASTAMDHRQGSSREVLPAGKFTKVSGIQDF